MDFHAAEAYIRAHGTPVEQARLAYLLGGKRPDREQVRQLFSDQRPDGSWAPLWAPGYSSLNATAFHLAQLDQLGLAGSDPVVESAVRFLVQRQHSDGSWEESAEVIPYAPPWALPGSEPARLYLTANSGFWVANYFVNQDPAVRAGGYLQESLTPEGRLPSYLHSSWLAAGLWLRLGQPSLASQVLDYLATRLSELESGQLAWMLTTLLRAGVSPDDPLIRSAAARMEAGRTPDGHWASADPGQDVHTTLEVMYALRLLER